MKQHVELLGKSVRDKVTGFEGVITTVSFDLYGCIQAVVTPPMNKEKRDDLDKGHWFDVTRLTILNDQPVMNPPDFSQGYVAEGRKGAASKPLP